MGQNSSVAVGTTKVAAGDASDSCVSGVKLRSSGIIPISQLIKQEKCSKNIQNIEKNYYNRKKSTNKHANEKFKSKKAKADFIESSFDDIPARRQWLRPKREPKSSFECDAVKVGFKKPSKTILNDNQGDTKNEIRDYERARYSEVNPEYYRNAKREGFQENCQKTNATRESAKVEGPRTSSARRNVAIGTQEFSNEHISRKNKYRTEKKNIVAEEENKSKNKYNTTEQKFHESSTQTITREKANFYETMKQLYKRNDVEERIRSRNKTRDGKERQENAKPEENKIRQHYPQKQYKHYKEKEKESATRALKEESSHQFQTHEISHPERKFRKYRQHLTMKTTMLCSISPEKDVYCKSNSAENTLGRCAGRNYINRKFAGESYSTERKNTPCNNSFRDVNYFNLNNTTSLLPSGMTLEKPPFKEHRKPVSAKEALTSWKNLHTWKQHRKQFERSRNQNHQGNFDAATQTMSARPKTVARRNKSNHRFLQTHPPAGHDDVMKTPEKNMYSDFISKMEHCLQKHSKICELHTKRNGEANYTWVQDKYRRWHKITFDNYRE